MEGVGGFNLAGIGSAATKRRSQTARRPRTQPPVFTDFRDNWSLSTTLSDSFSKGFSEDNNDVDMNSRKKERALNQCISNAPRVKSTETFTENDFERSSNADFAPVNRVNNYAYPSRKINDSSSSGQSGLVSSDGLNSERKVRKLKLKLGGVTHTLHTHSQNDVASGDWLSSKSVIQGTSVVSRSQPPSQRIREKNMSLYDLDVQGSGNYRDKVVVDYVSDDKLEAIRKSKRVPKQRIIEVSYEDSGGLRSTKVISDSRFEYEYGVDDGSEAKRSILRVSKRAGDRLETRTSKDIKTSCSGKSSDGNGIDYFDEEDMVSDKDLGASKRNKTKKTVGSMNELRSELVITTRQRALQTGKDVSVSGGNLLEFPNGLPPAPPKKQKEKLSELEQQLKRAEALQKRRMQVEKANQELEAEAIRKILGQDSGRKKKENQLKKRQEEIAQERAANALKLAPNVVRWTSNLNGVFVTFPEEMGLPSILKQDKSCYPPPREKCAGPSCPNTYKYRCSKTRLPLCSLQCYKAVQPPFQPSNACQ